MNISLMYTNRIHAGKSLADALSHYNQTNGVILAVPRGGVPVGCAVAQQLRLPLDLLLVKKIGHPDYPEFAIGAASINDYYVEKSTDVPIQYVEYAVAEIRKKLRASRNEFMGNVLPLQLHDKNVIIIDDGMATGHTMLAAVKVVRSAGARRIIVGVPVASRSSVALLEEAADEVVVPLVPEDLRSVGNYYSDFSQISDSEVKEYLDNFRRQHPRK